MDLLPFEPNELHIVMRTLRTAVAGEDRPDAAALEFLGAYADLAGHDGDPHELLPIAPRDIADVVIGAHARLRLVQLASVAALVRCPVHRDAAAYVRRLAKVLEAPDPVISVLHALARGRHLSARIRTMRRMLGIVLGEAYVSEGVLGPLRFLGAIFLRLTVNKRLAWSYKRLGLLPEGTLGREFWRHATSRRFGFPGEPGGLPQVVAYHDVAHVLTGYGTEPEGELQQAAFQAGCRRDGGFAFLQFALLQFHQGVQLTPVAKPEVGLFAPRRVFAALQRGSRCTVDMTRQWDFWPLLAQSLGEVRRQLAISPVEGGVREASAMPLPEPCRA